MVVNILVLISSFGAMEFVAWFSHKYLMHGWFWYLHKDHHQVESGIFEKNDLFFLIFAIPSAYCYVSGLLYHDLRLYVGIGISVYGLAYFFVHEIIIHQRIKMLSHINFRYVRAIRRAHKMHHKNQDKYHGQNFGMLIVPLKYWVDPTSTQ